MHFKNKSFGLYTPNNCKRYMPITFLMSISSYGSILLYGLGALLIGKLGPVVGWPLFTVLAILVSNFWGWYFKEWKGCPRKITRYLQIGLVFLVLAVLVLAYSVSLSG